jgi:F0F1-type ATP synthase epsilon subunit
MADTLELRVVNPVETLLEVDEAEWVHVRLSNGTGLTIYPGHAPLLAETVDASLRYADADGEHVFKARAGILKVRDDEVAVFTGHESEAEKTPKPSAVAEEREFARLARELRSRLEEESDSVLAEALHSGDEQA